ncbi:cation diffusion facilitator family transporter [Francisella tularensis subsp. novicida]|uniref:Cation diffusion facilitator family transporter n=2 Tax=Francisella tularensis TaxID=263 RepID=A0A6I4RSU9_FRATU|nr:MULTISPECIES: cation diffusion facilitator family transporter [Francisella]ABK89314.1 cation diffusion facilitator (CDF) family protein [Francisella tularensis subsp. novicida U112]AEB27352.1 Cobalt-zinc-cadmium resistance protein [Francisella cf. novicida Fx1]AJI45186.1 cation diffusion facilitator transporter family protein [Francisella tularensis subsp. novicida F6168]AJI61687.1 cation diffusion facilitator transporter family protein [Francisella tularensis subsp. novicida U112]AJI72484.
MKFDQQLEKKTLKTNLIVASIYALFSIIIVYFAQSLTVLLDTGYSVISILIYAVSIYVLRKINQPANKYYHYGYYRLEPIFIMLESWFVLLIAFSVILIALFNIFTHTIKPNYGIALLSEIVGTVVCVVMFLFVNKRAKKTGSKILFSDALMWKADALLGVGVIFNISIGFALEELGYARLALYVDPVVAILIGCYIMINPIKLGKEAYSHLLDAAPNIEFRNQIRQIAKQVAENYFLLIDNIKITQSGRFMFIDVYLDLPEVIETKKILMFKSKLQQQLQNSFAQNKLKVYVSF